MLIPLEKSTELLLRRVGFDYENKEALNVLVNSATRSYLQKYSKDNDFCPYCGGIFQKGGLGGHLKAFHKEFTHESVNENNNSYICEFCSKKFKSDHALVCHKGKMHKEELKERREKELPFVCPHCGSRHKTQIGLLNHVSHSHKEEVPQDCKPKTRMYFCDKCGKLHHSRSIIGEEHIVFKAINSDKLVSIVQRSKTNKVRRV